MSFFGRLFGRKRNPPPAARASGQQAASTASESKPLPSKPRGCWSERISEALAALPVGGPEAVSRLVELIFEGALSTSVPTAPDRAIAALLDYPGRSPASEVAAVQVAVQYQGWLHDCATLAAEIRQALDQLPGSQLKGHVLDLALAAAGYELEVAPMTDSHSHLPGTVPHTRISASQQASDQAVKELCGIVSPVTSNLLHKVAAKKDVVVRTGVCTRFSEQMLSFEGQRAMARLELARRGSPAYDQQAYVAG